MLLEMLSHLKIIVCPPRDTYTNLNYDLMKLGNTRAENFTEAFESLANNFVEHLKNIDFQQYSEKLKDGFKEENQFQNWYTGKRYSIVYMHENKT